MNIRVLILLKKENTGRYDSCLPKSESTEISLYKIKPCEPFWLTYFQMTDLSLYRCGVRLS